MPKRDAGLACLVFLSLVTGATGVEAQVPFPLGSEFLVNSHTPAGQYRPAVARDSVGNFVVTWTSYSHQDGQGFGVFARRFDSTGSPRGTEFQVSTRTIGNQRRSRVAAESNGDFVVVWESQQDGSYSGIFGQRFGAAGARIGGEFQVNTFTVSNQLAAAVGADADGDYVVAWTSFAQDGFSNGVFGRRFASNGSPLAAEFQISVFTTGTEYRPSVAVHADGHFVIVWETTYQDGSGYSISGRRFSSTGSPSVEFPVNTGTVNDQTEPRVAMGPGQAFVVVWQSYQQDGYYGGVFARRFDHFGSAAGAEFQVTSITTTYQGYPSVDMTAKGDFLVTWHSEYQDGSSYGVLARHFDTSGAPVSGELIVNSFTLGLQWRSDVSMDGDGDFVIAWQSDGQDGSANGVFAQRFARPRVLDIDGNGDVTPLTDGLLVLRYLFGFTGTTLTGGAVGNGCTRCNAAAIEPYLGGLV